MCLDFAQCSAIIFRNWPHSGYCGPKKAPKDTQRLDREIKNRLAENFEGKTLMSLTSSDIAEYRDNRLKKVGASSVRQDISFLSRMFAKARKEWKNLQDLENPCLNVDMPSPPKNRQRLLSEKEINMLLERSQRSTNKKLTPYIKFMLLTAMRPSEAAGLTWGQIQWEQRIVDLTETKTDPRRVPLVQPALDLLSDLWKEGVKEDQFVFLPNDGKVREIPSKFFRRSFETACRGRKGNPKKGTEGETPIKDVSLYTLRHAAGSYLLMRGMDLRTVADIMGHRNISQTQRY